MESISDWLHFSQTIAGLYYTHCDDGSKLFTILNLNFKNIIFYYVPFRHSLYIQMTLRKAELFPFNPGARCSFVVSVHSWCDRSSDRSFMVNPLSYFSLQPVLHDWCNKGHGMCNSVCGLMHIKELLLLIGKSSPLLLSEWSFTICPTPYNHK